MADVKIIYYETGELKSECFVINDKKNGIYKSYHPDGQLNVSCIYIDDIKK